MELIAEIQRAGIGVGFGNPHEGGYLMQQDPGEFAQLVAILMERKPKTFLQVGSAAGGCERFICEKVGVEVLHIMDLGVHPEFPTWTTKNKPALEARGVKVKEYIGDSHDDAAEEWLAQNGLKYDLIGIDGDHTPCGARMDWKLITPCLRPGTLVWLHDTHPVKMAPFNTGAVEVFAKLKERHKVLLDVQDEFGIGLVEIV